MCAAGVCSPPHAAYCAAFLSDIGWGGSAVACDIPGYECVRACVSNTKCLIASDTRKCGSKDSGILTNFKTMNGYSSRGSYSVFRSNMPSPYDTCQIADVGSACVVDANKVCRRTLNNI